jgi:hypothetical protein
VNRALWLLLGLQMRGWVRFLGRNLRTIKGALLALVGLVVFIPWVLSLALMPRHETGMDPEMIRLYGPAGLLIYCLGNLLISSGERGVYFTPAEVNFLFPGPFGRRELLAYKILFTLMISLPSTLIMALFINVRSTSFAASFLGLLLLFTFMNLFSMAVNLIGVTIGAAAYSRGRRLILFGVMIGAFWIAWQVGGSPLDWNLRELFPRVVRTLTFQTVMTPLRWFFEVSLATQLWPDLIEYSLLSLFVLVVLTGLVFALDAQYLETAAVSSARIYARLQRMRGRSTDGGGDSPGRKVRFGVPTLPWWGGLGPILWRQLTAALRGGVRLTLVLAILIGILMAPILGQSAAADDGSPTPVVPMLIGVGVWLTIVLSTVLAFDFRGDVDRMAVLKTLPLPAWRLSLGQVMTPVLIMTSLHWLVLLAALVASPSWRDLVLGCAAFSLPFNFLLFAFDNLMFLLFPTRIMAASPGDFQAVGRNVLFLLAKTMTLGMVAFLAGMVYFIAWFLTGGSLDGRSSGSVLIALGAAWPVVAVCGAALVPGIAVAFKAFDVSRDTPP